MNQKTYKNLCFFANIKSDALWTQSFSYLANSRKDVKPNNGMNYSKHIDRTFFRLLLIFHWLECSALRGLRPAFRSEIQASRDLRLKINPLLRVFRVSWRSIIDMRENFQVRFIPPRVVTSNIRNVYEWKIWIAVELHQEFSADCRRVPSLAYQIATLRGADVYRT